MADWNDGTFILQVAAGTGRCERISGNRTSEVTLDVGTLAQLVVGYRPAHALERTNRLGASDDAVRTLDELYPPERTYLGTGF